MRHAVIMAGGAGTRLWPMSRADRPKQLLPLISGTSLLQLAVERLATFAPPDQRWICTAEQYRPAVVEHLKFREDRILGEPVGRDTVNAVGFAAAVLEKVDPGAVVVILTADHVITPIDRFVAALKAGCAVVEQRPETLVTFSIRPTAPETGYGYIERGREHGLPARTRGLDAHAPEAFEVVRYVEKPDRRRAEQFIESGRFGWSSGMFAFRAATMLEAIDRYLPETREALKQISEAWETPRQEMVLRRIYPHLPRNSVDYAIMEPATRSGTVPVATVLMDIDWLDVGSWPALAKTIEADAAGNRTTAPAALLDCREVLAVSDDPDHLIAAIGCEGLVIVRTADATLVCPRDRCQEIKALLERVDASRR